MAENFDRFRRFLRGMTALCDAGVDETEIRVEGGALLRDLVASDDWLPSEDSASPIRPAIGNTCCIAICSNGFRSSASCGDRASAPRCTIIPCGA